MVSMEMIVYYLSPGCSPVFPEGAYLGYSLHGERRGGERECLGGDWNGRLHTAV